MASMPMRPAVEGIAGGSRAAPTLFRWALASSRVLPSSLVTTSCCSPVLSRLRHVVKKPSSETTLPQTFSGGVSRLNGGVWLVGSPFLDTQREGWHAAP